MYRSLTLGVFVAVTAVILLILTFSSKKLHDTLNDMDGRLRNRSDMDRYKAVIRGQMVLALVCGWLMKLMLGVWLLVVTPCIGFAFVLILGLTVVDVFLFVGLNLLVAGAAKLLLEGIEARFKTIAADSPELEQERQAVVHCWENRALPDWS